MLDNTVARVTAARGVLQTARDNLDEAVTGIPDHEGDNAMATPALLTLLLRAVEARRRLDGLEHMLTLTGTA